MEQPHSTTAQRKWKQLTEKDRYRLEAYFNAGLKTQEIAKRMGYSKRTIERERKLGLTPQLKPATKDIKTCGEIQTKLFIWPMWRKGAMKQEAQTKAGT